MCIYSGSAWEIDKKCFLSCFIQSEMWCIKSGDCGKNISIERIALTLNKFHVENIIFSVMWMSCFYSSFSLRSSPREIEKYVFRKADCAGWRIAKEVIYANVLADKSYGKQSDTTFELWVS